MKGARIDRRAAFAVIGALGLLVALSVPTLGSDPWPFRPGTVSAHGLLGPLVRAADGSWDLGVVRTPCLQACWSPSSRSPAGGRSRGDRGCSEPPASP